MSSGKMCVGHEFSFWYLSTQWDCTSLHRIWAFALVSPQPPTQGVSNGDPHVVQWWHFVQCGCSKQVTTDRKRVLCLLLHIDRGVQGRLLLHLFALGRLKSLQSAGFDLPVEQVTDHVSMNTFSNNPGMLRQIPNTTSLSILIYIYFYLFIYCMSSMFIYICVCVQYCLFMVSPCVPIDGSWMGLFFFYSSGFPIRTLTHTGSSSSKQSTIRIECSEYT